MPPGKHSVTPKNLLTGKAAPLTVNITEKIVPLLTASAEKIKEAGHDPFIDFNHNEDSGAAGHVKGFFWAGNDPESGGIRARINWTAAGEEALRGKKFTRFSPQFLADSSGNIKGINSANMGGLTNRPAFTKNESIVTATEEKTKMEPEEIKALIATAVAEAVAATNVVAMEAPAAAPSNREKILEAQLKVATDQLNLFKKKKDEDEVAASQALLTEAVAAGLVSPKDKAACDAFTANAKASPQLAQQLIATASQSNSISAFPVAATGPITPHATQAGFKESTLSATSRLENEIETYKATHNVDTDQALAALQAEKPNLFLVG